VQALPRVLLFFKTVVEPHLVAKDPHRLNSLGAPTELQWAWPKALSP